MLPAKYRRKTSTRPARRTSPRRTPGLEHFSSEAASSCPPSSPPSQFSVSSSPSFAPPNRFLTPHCKDVTDATVHCKNNSTPYREDWCGSPRSWSNKCDGSPIIQSPLPQKPPRKRRRLSLSPPPHHPSSSLVLSSPMMMTPCTTKHNQIRSTNSPATKRKCRTPPLPSAVKKKQRCLSPVSPPPQAASPSPSPPALVMTKNIPSEQPELMGFMIQELALSRRSSMAAPALIAVVLKSEPRLLAEREKSTWLQLARTILDANTVFGRIVRKGTDAHDMPLEDEWFYIPENDTDRQRAQMLQELKPGGGKRKATRRSAQYYYEPIVMSRWDPEDDD